MKLFIYFLAGTKIIKMFWRLRLFSDAHIKLFTHNLHLPFPDDQRIMTFLRGCKFSLEKAKRKLDMYFTMRAAVPEFFDNRDVTRPELKEILSMV